MRAIRTHHSKRYEAGEVGEGEEGVAIVWEVSEIALEVR